MKTFVSVMCKLSKAAMSLLLVAGMGSCTDDFKYDDSDPDFLGGSIYEYLEGEGNFKNYLRLVDDLDYKEVLSLTGSKTIFPANDEAFERFYQDNPYGVRSYDELSYAQKRSLLNSSMVNMAYLANMLSNSVLSGSTAGEGAALRRPSSYTYLDSVAHVSDAVQMQSPYWTRFAGKGLYLVDDDTNPYIVHFTPQHTATNNILSSDLSMIMPDYDEDTYYINGVKMVSPDVCCKNGYVHVMEDVLTPNSNMSQLIAGNSKTTTFNRLMNLFSAPYFDSSVDNSVHLFYDGRDAAHPSITDSVFVKRYFTTANTTDPQGNDMTNYGLLYFSPSQNSYDGNLEDMGVMFVPTDKAMDDYINGTHGRYLKDAYGSWDNVPTNLVALFVKNHQKKSFMTSLPAAWPTMNDENSFAMNVSTSDIEEAHIASNGIVYVTDKVYPPIDYQSVYASAMTSNDTKIMNWALQDTQMKFYLYLRSMENMYNLLVPTDEALQYYRDPVAWAKGKSSREIWAFRYDEDKDNPVTADIYSVLQDGSRGEYKRTETDITILRNRLNDICDRHIIVGNMDDDGNMSGYIDDGTMQYAQSKGGSTIKISGSGDNMKVTGGGDIEQGVAPARIVTNSATGQPNRYDADNGRAYFIDRVLQDPTNSVYTNMGAHSEYSKFFELLGGEDQVFTYFQGDSEIKSIFTLNKMSSSSGLGNVVSSFNNYRYTVFVPTNDAVDKAFAENPDLHTWKEIANQENETTKRKWAVALIRFLKLHFMDNSVYIDGTSYSNMNYETAARNDNGKFQRLTVGSNGSNLSITDPQGNVAHVVKTSGLYNLSSRDFIVNNSDYRLATQIISSSFSVMHLIDRALMPK